MKRKSLLIVLGSLLLSFNLFFSGCSKDSVTPVNKSRNVKFELIGTYTGKVTVAHTLANGGTQVFSDITLPWTKEVVYESSVLGLGFSGSGDVSLSNVPGQSVTINIYSDNKIVKTGSASVDSNQVLLFPSLTFLFPS
jgi:hypothetical protein